MIYLGCMTGVLIGSDEEGNMCYSMWSKDEGGRLGKKMKLLGSMPSMSKSMITILENTAGLFIAS